MAYPLHWRLVFGGALFGVEEWSSRILISDPGHTTIGDHYLDSPAALEDATQDLRTFFATPALRLPFGCKLEWVKLNQIGPDGRYVHTAESGTRILASSEIVSGASNLYLPPQIAVVATLRSARERGLAARGRMFLPCSPPVQADGLMLGTDAQGIATAVATLVGNLNNWPGIDATQESGTVCLVSKGGLASPDGVMAPVQRVEVGRAYDTQRRRRRSMPELPVSAAVPNA